MTRRTKFEFDQDDSGKTLYDTRREVPIDQWEGTWMGHAPVDMTGRGINPGDWLVKTYQSGRSCNMEIRQVREVRPVAERRLQSWETDLDRTPRVFLDDSKVPIQYPGRTLVVDWDPSAERLRTAGGGGVA